jgi:acetoin utilization protein AcuB
MTELMQQYSFDHLPVVQEDGELIGIVSQYDIQSAAPSAITTLSVGEANYLLAKITAQEIMQKAVIICQKDTLIEEAGQIMREHNISSLPVIDNKRLAGIVTIVDVLDFFLDITGCKQKDATRIAVRLSDKKGVLSEFLHQINELDCYIATVVAPTGMDSEGRRICIVRYYSDHPHQVDKQLKQLGYEFVTENFLAEQEAKQVPKTNIQQQETDEVAVGRWISEHDLLAKNLGIKTDKIGKGSCTINMKIGANSMNAAGVVHGGAVFALADTACAIAANSHNRIALTVSGNVNFQATAQKGDTLIAVAKEISLGNLIATYQVEIRRQSDDVLTALFIGTVFRKRESVI